MTRETKAGLVVSCSFLCLVGVVLYSKLNEKEVNGIESQDGKELAEMMSELQPVVGDNAGTSPENAASSTVVRQGENGKVADAGGVVPADYRVGQEHGNSNPIHSPAASPKEPAAKEQPMISPSPAVHTSSEPPVPPPSATATGSSPTTSSIPISASSGPAPGSTAPSSPGEELAPDREKKISESARSPSSGPPPEGLPAPARSEVVPPTAPAGGTESAAPGTPSPNSVKSVTTPGNPGGKATTGVLTPSLAPANAADASESAGGSTKPAIQPASLVSSLAQLGGAFTVKPAPSGATATVSSTGQNSADAPKPPKTEVAPPSAAKDWATFGSTPKQDVPPLTAAPPDSAKPAIQLPDPPPAAPGGVPSPKAPPSWPDKLPGDGAKSDITSPADSRPIASGDHQISDSGGHHKTPGGAEGTPAPGLAATPPTAPTIASPSSSSSSDTPSRANINSNPPQSPGPAGLTQKFGTHSGSTGGLPAPGSQSADRDKSSMPETAPLRPAVSPAPVDSGTEKSVQLGPPAMAPLRPSQSTQTPAGSAPVSSPGGESHARPLPALGATAMAVSPPISAPVSSGPAQSPAGGSPQVESYDENTYACKANDTFRTISQEVYHTDQYERSLLLFNRNHPLATNALQQDPPLLQAGQSIYIPPVRILEKYYGAPILDAAPPAPSPTPPTRAINHPDAAGSVRPANVSLGGPGIPRRSVLPPGTVPLYRVHDGGEMMLEIAKRTLGNGDRWTEIYHLNSRFDPKEVVPGGSQLQLPRDAHVDPRDVP